MAKTGFTSLRIVRSVVLGDPERSSRPRTFLLVLILANLIVAAPLVLHVKQGALGRVMGSGAAWADDGGDGDGGGGGGDGEGEDGGGDGSESADGNGSGPSISSFLSALRSHGEIATSHNSNGTLSVTYSDGWTEQVVGKTYQLLDRNNHTVVSRPAYSRDRARLKAAIRQ